MNDTPENPSPEAQLDAFRARIDAIDDAMIALILERTGVVQQVAALKSAHWPSDCHIRSGREGRMHRRIAARFAGTAFAVPAALTIWRQLIAASTHVESPLAVASLAAHLHHALLAREYFGAQAPQAQFNSVAEASADLSAHRANLLLLPVPSEPTLGDWLAIAQQHPQLKIFASLPITPAFLMPGQTPALALSAITPELSDDDLTYVLVEGEKPLLPGTTISHGALHLVIMDGFVAADDARLTAISGTVHWLGAHPRPLTLA